MIPYKVRLRYEKAKLTIWEWWLAHRNVSPIIPYEDSSVLYPQTKCNNNIEGCTREHSYDKQGHRLKD